MPNGIDDCLDVKTCHRDVLSREVGDDEILDPLLEIVAGFFVL
jgi:hypothetical protein